MSYPRKEVGFGVLACFAMGVAGFAGCAGEVKPAAAKVSKYRPADEAQTEAAPAGAAAEAAPIAVGATGEPPITIKSDHSFVQKSGEAPAKGNASKTTGAKAAEPPAPSGDVKQLVAYIDRLAKQQPKGTTQQEQLEDFVKTQQLRLAACQKVLTLNPDAATKGKIVDAMFEVFQLFGRLGVPGGRAQMLELAKTLIHDPDPAMARKGRHAMFGANVSQAASQPTADGKRILDEVQTLLDAEKDALSEDTLGLIDQAADVLVQSGLKEEAGKIFEMAGAAAAADPKLAERAKRYADRAKLAKVDLETLLTNVLTDQKDAEAKLVETVKGLLADVKPSRELFSNLQQILMYVEATGHAQTAKACFDQIESAFKDTTDEPLKAAVTRSAEGVRTRAGLIGQPFVVDGVTLDGKAFDWSAYAGKVVLVDFWATWCGPCLEELPNIRSNFEQFHARGFDVVGINLNTELNDVKQFFGVQELPWTTVTSQVVIDGKANEDWTQLPMAAKCGVDAIPFLVLVGKDGKVDSLHVRGPKLKTRLAQLLGEPPPVEIPTDPTVPAASPQGKPAANKKTGAMLPRGAISPVAFLMSQAMFGVVPNDPPADAENAAVNPYLAKAGLTTKELLAYIEKMLDRPKAIQTRAGFADAIAEACERVMRVDPPASEAEFLVAAEAEFLVFHREASAGKKEADEKLMGLVERLKEDRRPRIAHEVEFFRLERRVLVAGEAPVEQLPGLLKEVQEYVAKEMLTGKHLRLASSTVALINRLENGDEREKQFAQFGDVFAKSSDKDLARYGKKLAKKPMVAEAAQAVEP